MDSTAVSNITGGLSFDWNIILPILTYIGGFVTFWLYDRKIKKHQLKEYEKAEVDSKKALVKANVFSAGKSQYVLRIYNEKDAIATNIRLEVLKISERVWGDFDENFPHRLLNKGDKRDLNFTVVKCEGDSGHNLEVRILWDDDFKKDNSIEQVFTI